MVESPALQEHVDCCGHKPKLYVHVWILNDQGQFLLQKRDSASWFCTAGVVQENESSVQAAYRLAHTDLGLTLSGERSAVVMTYKQEHAVTDIWLFHSNVLLESLQPAQEKIEAIRWASLVDIANMLDNGEMVSMPYYDRFFEVVYRGVDAGV